MYIEYTKGRVTTCYNIRQPEVASNYIKYLLKNEVNEVRANNKIITLKGSRVYIDGKASTWGALPTQVGE